MKSKRAAIVDSEQKRSRSKKIKVQFVVCDEWDVESYGSYDCLEHARWATVLDFIGLEFSYQQHRIGCTYHLGMRPTFLLPDHGWFHCCSSAPNKTTKMVASIAADITNKPVWIVQGPMFIPDIDAPHDKEFAMPLWHTKGEGHSSTHHLCEIKRVVSIKYTRNILDCTTQKLCAAFRRGCALGYLSDVITT